MTTLGELQDQLRHFARARDWEQFHSPKNLAMALAGEVGELNALLQWVSADETADWLEHPANAESIRLEIADILSYLLLIADAVDVDPVAAALEKVVLNEKRYPVGRSRGTAAKYTDL